MAHNSGKESSLLPTVLAREVMQLPLSVCPPICFHSIFGTDWTLTLNSCIQLGHDHSLHGIEGRSHRSRSRSWIRLIWSVRPWLNAVFRSYKLWLVVSSSYWVSCLLCYVITVRTGETQQSVIKLPLLRTWVLSSVLTAGSLSCWELSECYYLLLFMDAYSLLNYRNH